MLEASSHTYKQRQVAIIVAQLRNTVKPIKNQSYNWNYNFPSFIRKKRKGEGERRRKMKKEQDRKKGNRMMKKAEEG